MQGNADVIELLNEVLTGELTAITPQLTAIDQIGIENYLAQQLA